MDTALHFEAHDEPLKDILFSTFKFRIPRYQRPYAWTEDQVNDFWTDLTGSKDPFFWDRLSLTKNLSKKPAFLMS